MNLSILWLLLILCQLDKAFAVHRSMKASYDPYMDNDLLDTPKIHCYSDTIEMHFKTHHPFRGKIYVLGHYSNDDCRVDYSKTSDGGDPQGAIRLHHGACDMDRQRMAYPEGGMQFSTTLVISFHPLFVTKNDKAFNINCMYRETAQTVTAGIDVSPITPLTMAYDMPKPICKYTIHKDELDGPLLKFAKVGDQVVHKWDCASDMYGMLVHSCYVEDGQGEKELVIDEKGCHIDRYVLGDPTYTKALNMAYREAYVFKFADRAGVRFACSIKLCLKEDDGCKGITPPHCSNANFGIRNAQHDSPPISLPASTSNPITVRSDLNQTHGTTTHNYFDIGENDLYPNKLPKGRRRKRFVARSVEENNTNSHRLNTLVNADLMSQYLFVLDSVDADAEEMEQLANGHLNDQKDRQFQSKKGSNSASICLSTSVFFTTLFVVSLCFGVATALIFRVLQARLKVKQHDLTSFARSSLEQPPSCTFLNNFIRDCAEDSSQKSSALYFRNNK